MKTPIYLIERVTPAPLDSATGYDEWARFWAGELVNCLRNYDGFVIQLFHNVPAFAYHYETELSAMIGLAKLQPKLLGETFRVRKAWFDRGRFLYLEDVP